MSALNKQVGGGHYKDLPIQPIEYVLANNLDFCEGSIVKYITRWKLKGGVEDLKKVIHYAEILIEQEESKTAKGIKMAMLQADQELKKAEKEYHVPTPNPAANVWVNDPARAETGRTIPFSPEQPWILTSKYTSQD